MSGPSVALNNLRAFAILSLLAFHSALAYLAWLPPSAFRFDSPPYRWVAFPIIDTTRWFGFDLFCAFNDTYLMSLMFFLSGVFVWPSLARRGATPFVQSRFLRLCVPALLVVLLLMPIAHYATYSVTALDPGFAAFWQHWLALPFWPSGPPWFLWLLFAFNVGAAAIYRYAPHWGGVLGRWSSSARLDPARYFFGLVTISALAYVPLALLFDPWRWFEYGIFAFQISRPIHYAVYFLAGLGVGIYGLERGLLAPDGMLAQRWRGWLAAAAVAFALWLGTTALSIDEAAGKSAIVQIAAHLAFVLSCASSCFALFAMFLRFGTRSPFLESAAENSYGMYLVHYVFVVWLQYAMLGVALPAIVKGALVFAGVVALSWIATSTIQRAPLGERLIGVERRVLAKAP